MTQKGSIWMEKKRIISRKKWKGIGGFTNRFRLEKPATLSLQVAN
jgi:hypothetical protein